MPCPLEQIEPKSILLGQYEFLGPYLDPADVKSQAGLLAVLVQLDRDFQLVELNESADLRRSARFVTFSQRLEGVLSFAVYYTNGSGERGQLREEILKEFDHGN